MIRVHSAVVILILISISIHPISVNAQDSEDEIQVNCSNAEINVSPNSLSPGFFMCELNNPSSEQKTVEISIIISNDGGIVSISSYPSEVIIEGGETIYFNSSASAPVGSVEMQFKMTIYAQVISINGNNCENCGDSSWNFLGIIMIYPDFDILVEDLIIMKLRDDGFVNYNINNTGNSLMRFRAGILFQSDSLFTIESQLKNHEISYNESYSNEYKVNHKGAACDEGIDTYEEEITINVTSDYPGVEALSKEKIVTLRVNCNQVYPSRILTGLVFGLLFGVIFVKYKRVQSGDASEEE